MLFSFLCPQTFQERFPTVTVRFRDLCIVAEDGELATIEVIIENDDFPHKPGKKSTLNTLKNEKNRQIQWTTYLREIQKTQQICYNKNSSSNQLASFEMGLLPSSIIHLST